MVLRHVWTLLAVSVVVVTSGCCRDRLFCCRHQGARTCGLHKKCCGRCGGGGCTACAPASPPVCPPVCTPVCTPCIPACAPVGGCSMECGYPPLTGLAAAPVVSSSPLVVTPAAVRMSPVSSSLEPPLR